MTRSASLMLLWMPTVGCAEVESALAAVTVQEPPAVTVQAAALPSAARLPALQDRVFATHPFEVPWVDPSLTVTLFLPPDSTRGPELAVSLERSLRVLTQRWSREPCRAATQIDVYFVPPSIIEDRSRFDLGSARPQGELWGVYSPWGGAAGVVAITLRDLDGPTTAKVLGHELAHHWHDRLCLDGDTEAFAQAFESMDWPHAIHTQRHVEAPPVVERSVQVPDRSLQTRRERRRAQRAARRSLHR